MSAVLSKSERKLNCGTPAITCPKVDRLVLCQHKHKSLQILLLDCIKPHFELTHTARLAKTAGQQEHLSYMQADMGDKRTEAMTAIKSAMQGQF